jgi:hypothetical protein
VLSALIARHGPPRLAPEHDAPLRRVLGILLWGELAAWAIAADLAEHFDDIEAKMAATSQAHDEARHFYVLRDYCRALGGEMPRIGGVARRLLLNVLNAGSLAEKLVGMQLLVESNALAFFRSLVEADVDPVLSELLPYYERDEARHVGLGVMYLPKLLSGLSRVEAARMAAFQIRCIGYLMTGGVILRDDFAALGIDQRRGATYVLKLQSEMFEQMLEAPPEPGRRRRDAVRGMLGKELGAAIVDFLNPPADQPSSALRDSVLAIWGTAGRALDRALA